jgi:hypothetical protein
MLITLPENLVNKKSWGKAVSEWNLPILCVTFQSGTRNGCEKMSTLLKAGPAFKMDRFHFFS